MPIIRNLNALLLGLGENVLFAINLVQVTALTISAGHRCATTLRVMREEDRHHELLGSPSEAAWDEYNRPRT